MIFSNFPITYDDFKDMINKCKNNIVNGKSKVFDYPEDLEKYNIEDLLDYDDIIFEIQENYGLSIGRSRVPLIWESDCWEADKNYSRNNPPILWRMFLYEYGY